MNSQPRIQQLSQDIQRPMTSQIQVRSMRYNEGNQNTNNFINDEFSYKSNTNALRLNLNKEESSQYMVRPQSVVGSKSANFNNNSKLLLKPQYNLNINNNSNNNFNYQEENSSQTATNGNGNGAAYAQNFNNSVFRQSQAQSVSGISLNRTQKYPIFKPYSHFRQSLLKTQQFLNQLVESEFLCKQCAIEKPVKPSYSRLYAELLKEKNTNNLLLKENMMLKTQVQSKDEEFTRLSKKDETSKISPIKYKYEVITQGTKQSEQGKVSSEFIQNINSDKPDHETSLILSLKQQVKALTDDLRAKEIEMTQIKRDTKLTKISELEFEIQSYSDETIRLRLMLQQALNIRIQDIEKMNDASLEERYHKLLVINDGMRKENSNLNNRIREVEQKNQSLEVQVKEIENSSQKYLRDKTNFKKQLIEKEQELDRLRNIQGGESSNKKDIGAWGAEMQLKNELEKKINDCSQLTTELTKERNEISKLQREIEQERADNKEKLSKEQRDKIFYQQKSQKLDIELKESKEKNQQLILNRNIDHESPSHKGSSTIVSPVSNPDQSDYQFEQKEIPIHQIPKIQMDDIQHILLEVRYQMLDKEIDFIDLDKALFKDFPKDKEYYNIDELRGALNKQSTHKSFTYKD